FWDRIPVGFAAALVYDGAYAGGRLIDDYVGIRAIAPSIDLVAPSGYGIRNSATAKLGAISGRMRSTQASFSVSSYEIGETLDFMRFCGARAVSSITKRSFVAAL
ncbi:MAG: hypothetical protein ACYDA5_06340, partial [Vulcanimicrobiaceae bacterium]